MTTPDGTKKTVGEVLTTYDAVGTGTVTTNSVVSAVYNINEQGTKYFHVNGTPNGVTSSLGGERDNNAEQSQANGGYATAIGYKAVADGTDSVAIGRETKTTGNSAVAIGNASTAGEQSIAVGDSSQAVGLQSIAIGIGNLVSGNNSGAIGDPTVVTGDSSYSVGNNNTISTNNTYALGSDITATVGDSVFLGDKSSSTGVHTTADGGNYTYAGANDVNVAGVTNSTTAPNTVPVGVVSVGTEGGQTRQIQNVAAGVVSADSTDAINGSQLYYTNEAITNLAGNTINMGNQLNARIDDVEDDANAGVSSAMAMAALPQAYIAGKSMLTGGMATYNGEGAVAVGFSKLSDNGRWVLKMSGSADTQGNAGAAVGAGFHF
ncbi:Adhesin yadA precursor [Moraxella lacunata]|uniref:Adhesin yadA n=1 Tax=Moraxella lacunata TaxID=477 RepID=A0A378QGK7_MORLA|nr:YadA-like family protein [Moraxella lacunata]STZ00039.1 Adhesin yadA precursor [Moraxella lacunata]